MVPYAGCLIFREPEGQLARWLEVLASYDFTIQHRAGRSHQNADAMSRYPCKQCSQANCGVEEQPCGIVRHLRVVEVADLDDVDALQPAELRQWQLKDQDVRTVLEWREAGVKPPWEEVQMHSPEIKALWGKWEALVIQEDVLYLKWEAAVGDEVLYRLVVPRGLQKLVLKWLHDEPTSGHLGFKKTWDRAVVRFYWFKMDDSIRLWIAKCLNCAKAKGVKSKAPMQSFMSGAPLEVVAVDLLVSLPLTKRGNRHIMVTTCKFSKFAEAYPIPNIEAETVASNLVDGFITRYGVPRQLHSIHISRSSPYHPQGSGQVERCNRSLRSLLAVYAEQHQDRWDEHLQMVMMAYRSAVHESTGQTPNRVMFGREVTLPLDLALGLFHEGTASVTNYAATLSDVMHEVHELVRTRLKVVMRRQKRYYDRNAKEAAFSVGDVVMITAEARKKGVCQKLRPRWEGPFLITQKLSDVNVRVQQGPHRKAFVVHVNRLKKFLGDFDDKWFRNSSPQPRRSTRNSRAPEYYGEWIRH